jgi:hypothetical protein
VAAGLVEEVDGADTKLQYLRNCDPCNSTLKLQAWEGKFAFPRTSELLLVLTICTISQPRGTNTRDDSIEAAN